MSAAEDDSELRDLLIHNLENRGVLNKLKAQMRAVVFLSMEEQDRLENRGPLANEPLEKCLRTRDGRLVAGLIVDFLQHFNLDLSLSVFRPEINCEGLDTRDLVSQELGLADEPDALLLQVVRRQCRQAVKFCTAQESLERSGLCVPCPQEPVPRQLALARAKFDLYDPDHRGFVRKEDLPAVFKDLLPGLSKNIVERFIDDELGCLGGAALTSDFQTFVTLYRRLFAQCRTVVFPSSDAAVDQAVDRKLKEQNDNQPPGCEYPNEELEDGDSFFDDPFPQPQKTYGRDTWVSAGSRVEDSSRSVSETHKMAGLQPEDHRPGGRTVSENSARIMDEDYDDDFNSHRSDLTRSDLSIGEEIEEVSIEGQQDSEQCDETQDVSVSRLSPSPAADYMEDVS